MSEEFRKYLEEGYKSNRKYSSKEAERYWQSMNGPDDFMNDIIKALMEVADSNGNDVAMDLAIDFKARLKKLTDKDFYDKAQD